MAIIGKHEWIGMQLGSGSFVRVEKSNALLLYT